MNGTQELLLSVGDDGVAVLTLNRPAKRNAVTLAMWRQLGGMAEEIGKRDDIRVLVLTGAGGNFCAGADISEFATVRADAETGRIYEAAAENATIALRDCAKPTIAAVTGYGVGGGCGLALACDIRIGDSTTRMGIPAARRGLVYGSLDCALLCRQVGLADAKLVLFSGRHFEIDDCERMRLVDIVAETTALEEARLLAAELAGNAPLSLSGAKFVLEAVAAGTAAEKKAAIEAVIDRAMDSDDYKEGARAFLEKRRPVFTGR